MSNPVYSISISARAVLNLHSLNNEGGEGNQIQTRMVDIVYYDDDRNPQQANVNAVSGDMLKHMQAAHLQRLAAGRGLPLCAPCHKFDANRMSADDDFRAWLKGESPTPVQVLDRLLSCTIDDMEGNLVTEGKYSVPRKSVVEFGWMIGVPEAVTTDQYFHVKYVPDNRKRPEDEDGREGNLGQSIFHRPASSGVYALVSHLEVARIGYNDITQEYVDGVDRQARYQVLVESVLYALLQMNGAMRNTQLPHLSEMHGVVTVSHGPIPAPLVSPLNRNFESEIERTSEALNQLEGGPTISRHPFATVGELSNVLGTLARDGTPFELRTGVSD